MKTKWLIVSVCVLSLSHNVFADTNACHAYTKNSKQFSLCESMSSALMQTRERDTAKVILTQPKQVPTVPNTHQPGTTAQPARQSQATVQRKAATPPVTVKPIKPPTIQRETLPKAPERKSDKPFRIQYF